MSDTMSALVGFGIMFAFWSKANAGGGSLACWEWGGALAGGYGQFRWNGKRTTAIRLARLLTGAEAPLANEVVRHTCDNSRCVNPDHLKYGSFADNTGDMMSRGRWVITTAKLTPAQVFDVRSRSARGEPTKSIAAAHGVSIQAVYDIRQGRTWSHLEGP